jgi:CBS domain-containing membrane protein
VACYELLDHRSLQSAWLSAPVAAALALMAMQLTGTVHPPAGGTVLIAAMGSDRLHAMGFALLLPTFAGATILVLIAMLNNLVPGRVAKAKYPLRWW